jgi:hypothetical protein
MFNRHILITTMSVKSSFVEYVIYCAWWNDIIYWLNDSIVIEQQLNYQVWTIF